MKVETVLFFDKNYSLLCLMKAINWINIHNEKGYKEAT